MTHTSPVYRQAGQRAYIDSAAGADSLTAYAAENVNPGTISLDGGDVFIILRTEQEETDGGAGNNPCDLEFQINGGGYAALSTITTGAQNANNSEACTTADAATGLGNLLTTSTRTFNDGIYDNNGSTGNLTYAGNDMFEVVHAIRLVAADLSNGDTLNFRSTNAASWLNTLTFTVSKTAVGGGLAKHPAMRQPLIRF